MKINNMDALQSLCLTRGISRVCHHASGSLQRIAYVICETVRARLRTGAPR